jgi:hypothetical protein
MGIDMVAAPQKTVSLPRIRASPRAIDLASNFGPLRVGGE